MKKGIFLSLFFVGFLFCFIFVLGCEKTNNADEIEEKVIITINNNKIIAEVADEPLEREIGLMNRTSLGKNKGMLFVFEQENPVAFWMKDTLIPLDIIFANKDMEIVEISENLQPCKEAPCPTFKAYPVKYALEVNAGYAKEKGIKTGDRLEVEQ